MIVALIQQKIAALLEEGLGSVWQLGLGFFIGCIQLIIVYKQVAFAVGPDLNLTIFVNKCNLYNSISGVADLDSLYGLKISLYRLEDRHCQDVHDQQFSSVCQAQNHTRVQFITQRNYLAESLILGKALRRSHNAPAVIFAPQTKSLMTILFLV